MGLGIERHLDGLVEIGLVININMTDAMQMFDHWYPCLLTDTLDQAFSTTRHDHIHVLRHGDQFTDRRAICGFHYLHDLGGQTSDLESLVNAGSNSLVGILGFGTPSQDRSIP